MKEYNIFLSSSTEGLEDERKIFSTIIEKRIKIPGIRFTAKLWEEEIGTSSQPNEPIQESINPILPKCDLIVFIFYNKLGKGVLEEYNRAIKLKKRIIFFQKKCTKSIEDFSVDELNQYKELKVFIKDIKENKSDKIFVNEYDHLDTLEIKLRKCLENLYGNTEDIRPVYSDKIQLNTIIPHNNNFVGRIDEIKEIGQFLDSYKYVAIYGMGGMGKTSIAAKYCEDAANKYDKIIWLPFHINLEETIMSLEACYNYKNDGNFLKFGDIVTYLNSIEGRKLLVVDNFDVNKEDINKRVDEIIKYFSTYRILFTTRTNLDSREEDIYLYNLVELKREESILLFKKYYKNDFNDYQVTLEQLSYFLDAISGHTLITELVAKTLRNHFSINMSEIIGYIKHENDFDNTTSVSVKWHDTQLAISDVSSALYNKRLLSDEESKILEILAILCEENIDVRYLMVIVSPNNRKKFEDLINRLTTNGWINKYGFMVSCHRILADIILKDAKIESTTINFILENLNTKTIYNALDDITAKRPYYQMQRLLITYICDNLHSMDGISHELIANNAINYFYNGDSSDIEKRNRKDSSNSDIVNSAKYKFLSFAKDINNKNSILICHVYECLSKIYRDSYNYEEALWCLKEAVRIEKELNVGNTIDVARTSKALADFYDNIGEKNNAIRWLQQSYNIYSNILGKYCIENLWNCLLFASIFDDLESNEDKTKWADLAEKIMNKSDIAEYNPLKIKYYRSITVATNSDKIKNLDIAEEVAMKIYGERHPILAEIYAEKGVCLADNKKYDEAICYIEKWHADDIFNFGYNIVGEYLYEWLKNITHCKKNISKDGVNEAAQEYLNEYDQSICSKNEDNQNIPINIRKNAILLKGYAHYWTAQYLEALKMFRKVNMILSEESNNSNSIENQMAYSCLNSIVSNSKIFITKINGEDERIQNLDNIVRCLVSLGHYEQAKLEVDNFQCNTNSDSNSLKTIKARINLYLGEYTQADFLFKQVIKESDSVQIKYCNDRIARIILEYATDVFNDGDYKKSLKFFQMSLSYYKNGIVDYDFEQQIYYDIACVTHILNGLEKSTEYFNISLKAIEKDAYNVEYRTAKAYGEYGSFLYDQGLKEDSIIFFKNAISILTKENTDDYYSVICRLLSIAQREIGQFISSIETMQDCIEIQSDMEDITSETMSENYHALGLSYFMAEKYEEAEETANKALELNPELNKVGAANILNLLALISKNLGNYDKTVEYYKNRISVLKNIDDDDARSAIADTLDDLATLLYQLDRNEEAIGYFKEGLGYIEGEENSISQE